MATPQGPLTFYKAVILVICAIILSVAFYLRSTTSREYVLTGHTMGVTYTLRYVEHKGREHVSLAREVEKKLQDVNDQMSTWQKQSEISQFNKSSKTDWQTVSPDFVKVVTAAQDISAKTQGRYDISLGPLIALWGFQDNQTHDFLPDSVLIEQARQKVGWQKLSVQTSPPALKKDRQDLEIDLSSIAKGFGVDVLAELLEHRHIKDYMVEIGGEIRVNGRNLEGQNWRIAIETPQIGQPAILRQLSVSQGGIATSGDYRNYYEVDGERYSHLIDPLSAAPIRHKTVSVTVVAESSMHADGWATAMMILGADKGIALAEEIGLAALFIVRDTDHKTGYRLQTSSKISPYLTSQNSKGQEQK